jgi:hypothetical protein
MSSVVPDRAAWLDGMRALCDVLTTEADVPLPLHAADAFKFSTTEAAARLIAEHLDDVREIERPRAFILDRMITGTLAGQAVAIYFGTRTGVTV